MKETVVAAINDDDNNDEICRFGTFMMPVAKQVDGFMTDVRQAPKQIKYSISWKGRRICVVEPERGASIDAPKG
jgi:hypothetical protein